jgi:hypothetical protein
VPSAILECYCIPGLNEKEVSKYEAITLDDLPQAHINRPRENRRIVDERVIFTVLSARIGSRWKSA